MSTITGNLSDAGLTPFAGRVPRLRFRLDRPGAAGANVVTTEPVDAAITDATGAFTVEVVSTEEILPGNARYTVTADWDAGRQLDVITGLRVPPGAWTLTDLLITSGAASAGTVVYGFGPPPPGLQGVLYIDIAGTHPVLYAPSNGGI